MGRAYPPEAPVLWIKYGRSVIWNEVTAQATAHKELRGLQSQVKAPAVFYACEMELPRRNGSEVTYCIRSYVVMEYIPGKTAGEWLKVSKTPLERISSIPESLLPSLNCTASPCPRDLLHAQSTVGEYDTAFLTSKSVLATTRVSRN